MDRGAWRATDHGVVKSQDTTQRLNNSKNATLLEDDTWKLGPGFS